MLLVGLGTPHLRPNGVGVVHIHILVVHMLRGRARRFIFCNFIMAFSCSLPDVVQGGVDLCGFSCFLLFPESRFLGLNWFSCLF